MYNREVRGTAHFTHPPAKLASRGGSARTCAQAQGISITDAQPAGSHPHEAARRSMRRSSVQLIDLLEPNHATCSHHECARLVRRCRGNRRSRRTEPPPGTARGPCRRRRRKRTRPGTLHRDEHTARSVRISGGGRRRGGGMARRRGVRGQRLVLRGRGGPHPKTRPGWGGGSSAEVRRPVKILSRSSSGEALPGVRV